MWKIDFHVHTPDSLCYLDHVMPEANSRTSAQDIIGAAQDAGLDALVITDHNSVEGIESLKEAAELANMTLFPGIEISARGGHVLAVFELDTEMEHLRYLLRELGFKEEHQGQGFQEAPYWMDEVFAQVGGWGGLAIAAHIDRRPRGFVASEENLKDKVRIYTSPYLSAIEITIPQNKRLWNKGQMPQYFQERACVQGSDAHAPKEIGRRPVYLDIPYLNLDGLCLAFQEFETRLWFPGEVEERSPLFCNLLP